MNRQNFKHKENTKWQNVRDSKTQSLIWRDVAIIFSMLMCVIISKKCFFGLYEISLVSGNNIRNKLTLLCWTILSLQSFDYSLDVEERTHAIRAYL